MTQITFNTSFDKTIIKGIINSSLPIFLAALVIVPAQWGVNYLIFSREKGNLALSIFGVANQWMVLIQFFPLQISKVVLPFLTKQEGISYIKTEKIGLYLSVLLAMILILFSLLFERYIIQMYKFDYNLSDIPFKIMLIASLFSILNMYFGQTIIAKGQSWYRTIADLMIAVSLFFSFVVLLKYTLLLALPLSYCFSYLIGFCSILVLRKVSLVK